MGATVREHSRRGWVVTTHAGGKRKQRSFGRGPEAEERARAFAAAVDLEARAGDRWLDEVVPRTDEAVRGWLAHYRGSLSRSYEATASGLVEGHLAPWFGSRPLSSIGEPELLAFVEHVFESGLSSSTATNALSILRRVCSLHVEAGVLDRNPVANLGRLVSKVGGRYATEVDEVEAWTPDEALELLELARQHEPHVAPVLLAAFHTGMRRGELLGLEWRDVKRRSIVVRRALVAGRMKTPKSGKSREVPISPELRELLAELRSAIRTRRAFRDAGPVFLSPRGERWDVHNFGRAFRRLEKHAVEAEVPFLRFHDARHSFATWALEGGRSIRWVQEILGHSSAELTLRTYAHVVPREDDSLEFLPASTARMRSRKA